MSAVGIPRTNNLAEIRAIHRHVFQDVFQWAGQIRTVDIAKGVEGSGFFVPFSMIERAADFTSGELSADNNLKGMQRRQFITRLAHHYDQLNYIHPFRDGNGRTQRIFWDRVATDAGWRLSWLNVTGGVNDTASRIAAETQDLGPLIAMFETIVAPIDGSK